MQDIPQDRDEPREGALRLFFVDEKTGNPVAGVVLSIVADSPRFEKSLRSADSPRDTSIEVLEQNSIVDRSVHLATLQTDQAGYASFKFDRSILTTGSRLTVTRESSLGNPLVVNIANLLAGDDVYTIRFNSAESLASVSTLGFPAVMSPDARDLLLSPRSIGLIPQLLPGGGLCSQLMPTTLGARRFRAIHVLADICNPEVLACNAPVQIVKGKLLEYEIVWYSAGTSLGDLLNTITLAPCEQVNIAVADWMRREATLLNQSTDVQQTSLQEMNHERLILEAMNSAVKNDSSAWSIGGTVGTAAKDITAAFGGGFSSSTSTQQIALNTSSRLSDRITQAASFVASQRSSVVFQASASEQQTYQTRSIRNHNHCHTLTLMYFQVNRSYRVVTDYKGARDIFLVKCDNADFDAKRAYDNLALLKPALLEPDLLSGFDALADALFCCNIKPPVTEWLMDSLTMTFWVKEFSGNLWWFNGTLTTATGVVQFGGSAIPLSQWHAGGMYKIPIPLPSPIAPQQVVSIVLDLIADPTHTDSLTLSKIEVTGHVIGLSDPLSLYLAETDTTISNTKSPSWLGWLVGELPGQPGDQNECVEKSCPIRKLLGHLNSHKRYYNTILCFNQDPNERVVRWSCCRKDDMQFSLIDQIENTPITVYGDYIVFPAAGGELVDDPSILPVSKLVMIPTPGVYAEGILGQCNTCETIDPSRFWDWKDSPCGDSAPAVSSPPTPQPGVKPSDLKTEAISNLITFTSVPGAPDSAMKDLISSLVSKADSGSSEAKDLLTKLLDTIKESIPKPKA